jgi:hypothetical protein
MLAVAVAVAGVCGSLIAADVVGVPGSSVQFPTRVEASVADRPVALVLTGAAVRQKVLVNVYCVASYLQEGVRVASAEELAAVNGVKRLQLVMERDVSGGDMADAFRAAIRQNYPEPAFNAEVGQLVELLRGTEVHRGDQVWLTHVPGVGLQCSLVGKTEFVIRNPAFSRAVWDIYLGARNLGDGIKKGLTSRL